MRAHEDEMSDERTPTLAMFAHWIAIVVFCVLPLAAILDVGSGRVALVMLGAFAALALVEYLHGLWDFFIDMLELR